MQSTYAFVGHSNLMRVSLATGADDPFGGIFLFTTEMAADDQHVYFTGAYDVGQTIYQDVERRSVTNQNSGDTLTGDYTSPSGAIALDTTHVYFAIGTHVGKIPK